MSLVLVDREVFRFLVGLETAVRSSAEVPVVSCALCLASVARCSLSTFSRHSCSTRHLLTARYRMLLGIAALLIFRRRVKKLFSRSETETAN